MESTNSPHERPRARRRWLRLAIGGFALVMLAMTVVALVLLDKEHFGWLVGSAFLQIIAGGVVIGAILLLLGAWKLSVRGQWRGILLLVWGVVALTSPFFGFLFLLPWALLLVLAPFVIGVLYGLARDPAST